MSNYDFDGETLDLNILNALASGSLTCGLTKAAWGRVAKGRAIVDRALNDGSAYYGINTGVGSQKDCIVDAENFAWFNHRLIISEATNMPGPAFDETVVRGALAVMLNNAATGRQGVRVELVERMLRLFQCDRMPEVRRGTSGGTSDLGPLAQLSLPLVGHSLNGFALLIDGPYELAAKEAVSLLNSNAFALSHGAKVLTETQRLIAAFDLATVTSFEALRANLSYYHPSKWAAYRNVGQLSSCRRIVTALEGSALWNANEWRSLHDALSFRFAMRVNGAAINALDYAQHQYFEDLNCVCDNPVISLEDEAIVTGVNMDSTMLTTATDMLRQSLAKISTVSTERSLKLQNLTFSGLNAGLAQDGDVGGGVLNLIVSYISTARQAELRNLAAPVLLDCSHSLADGIEDVSSLAPLSIQRTEEVVNLSWQIVAVEMLIAVWAIYLRKTPVEKLGHGPRHVYETILPYLPIGTAGEQVFDIEPLIQRVSAPEFMSDVFGSEKL